MPRARAAHRIALATGLCLSVHACDDVGGGAVELSWKLRPAASAFEDKFVECVSRKPGTGPVTHIRLDWEVDDQTGVASWPCDDSHGTTGFDLPEGFALLRVTPVCGITDATPASYIAPAAEQRRVIVGNTVSLGAIELVVVVAHCEDQDCICE